MSDPRLHLHGDLRHHLIETGIAQVDGGGVGALSIRKAATQAGVSHAAPAHHFPSLTHFRTAVVTEGYRRFAASMRAEMARAELQPRPQLVAACRGYFAFASAHPGLFDLMFSTQPFVQADPEFWSAQYAAYQVLSEVSAPYGRSDPAGRRVAEMRIWSFIHGFSGLAVGKNVMFSDPAELERMIDVLVPDFATPAQA
ncbi:TetR/AcrR family transcriptional regulator [uncultured Maritimibacter sp.]|jgi:AcrR family transcriptional regulator|uniref:TetR/AcrR family transcriptional regulator n=1 Tax=uncultured Maritimibacter sp. TaxID=991866 RepID=UPI000AF7953E|nr:TetR-like C-terminal domain-containing protein [uncultured Maritimibacter sp.]